MQAKVSGRKKQTITSQMFLALVSFIAAKRMTISGSFKCVSASRM